jgi:hypothetical protein
MSQPPSGYSAGQDPDQQPGGQHAAWPPYGGQQPPQPQQQQPQQQQPYQQPYPQQPYQQQPDQPGQQPLYGGQTGQPGQQQYGQPQQQPPYGGPQQPYQQQPGQPGQQQYEQQGQPVWAQGQQGYQSYPGQYQQQFHQAQFGTDESDAGSDVLGGILLVLAGLAGVLQPFVFEWANGTSGWRIFDIMGFGFSEVQLLGMAPVIGLAAGAVMILLSIGCFARMRSRVAIAIPGLLLSLIVLGLAGYIAYKSDFDFGFWGIAFYGFIACGLLGLIGSIKAFASR